MAAEEAVKKYNNAEKEAERLVVKKRRIQTGKYIRFEYQKVIDRLESSMPFELQ